MSQGTCRGNNLIGVGFANLTRAWDEPILKRIHFSHQLIKLTPKDQQQGMVGALHDAYFERGEAIGQMGVLLDIAKEQGLDVDRIEQCLKSQEKLPEVQQDLSRP